MKYVYLKVDPDACREMLAESEKAKAENYDVSTGGAA